MAGRVWPYDLAKAEIKGRTLGPRRVREAQCRTQADLPGYYPLTYWQEKQP